MITTTRSDGLCVLTLNRPDKRNALTRAMLEDVKEAFADIAQDQTTKAVILTGAGQVFSAGADLDAARAGLATDPIWNAVSDAVAACPVLTIAALNGTAAGGSLGMVLACDLVVAAPSTTLFYPVMKLGFLPQSGDVARLKARVGPARTALLLQAGHRFSASEARDLGLVDVLAEDTVAAARGLAEDALSADRAHGAAIKAMLRDAAR